MSLGYPPLGPALPGVQPMPRRPLPPDEADSLGKQLLGYSSSMLQTGLHVLDTPGSIVRGVVGSIVGARPAAGERTIGRDITDALGITDRHSKSFLSHVPGLLFDIGLDPLSYLSFGTSAAATGAGKALAKTGATAGWSRRQLLRGFDGIESKMLAAGTHSADDIAHLRNAGRRIATPEMEQTVARAGGTLTERQPLAGLVGLSPLPLKAPTHVFGIGGPLAETLAGRLDAAGDWIKHGNTLGRWGSALFDPSVREATGPATQRAMSRYGTPAYKEAQAQGRADLANAVGKIHDALGQGFQEGDVLRAGRMIGEGAVPRNIPTGLEPLAREVGSTMDLARRRQLAEATELGLPLPNAADPFTDRLPRHMIDLNAARNRAAGGRGAAVGPLDAGPIASVWRAIPGGTEQVNDWVRQYAGNPGQLTPSALARQFRRDMLAEHQATGALLTREIRRTLADKATALAERIPQLSPDYSTHGIGLFSNDLTHDVARSAEQHARSVASGRAVMGLIGDEAKSIMDLPSDAVPISQVLDDLKFVTRPSDAATGTPVRGALAEAYRNLARVPGTGASPLSPPLLSDLGRLRSEVDRFALPRNVYDELVRGHVKWNTPSTIRGPLNAFDQATTAFKNLVYPLWPASHVRNAVSAGLNNMLSGTSLKDHTLQARLMRNTATASELRRVVPDLPATITDDPAARQWVRDQQFAAGKVYDGSNGALDLDQIAGRLAGSGPGQGFITPTRPGADRTGGKSFLGDTLGLVGGKLGDQARLVGALPGDLLRAAGNKLRAQPLGPITNPIEMSGVLHGTQDFPALELGRTVGSNIEDLFRGAQWLGAVRQGHTAESAGRLVNATHFDYQDLTDFERNVMRRLAPFYTFSRKNLPAQVDRLVHTPGSVTTQMRLMGLGRDNQDYVPDYLASGVAIPTGPEADGKRQFVSSLGTPLEESLEPFRFKGGLPDLTSTARSFAGRLNPLLKAPLERLFDTQFQTGRRLSELRPPATVTALGHLLGDDNPQLLAQLVANTPFTRFFTTADKLIDDRKGPLSKLANMLTGVRVSDVDLNRTRRSETAEARNELLRAMPHVAGRMTYYPRPGEAENLTPEEVELLRLQATLPRRPILHW